MARNKALTWALENPKATNTLIALAGLTLLLAYAALDAATPPLAVGKFVILQEAGTKVLATFCKELGLAAMVAVLINFSIEAFNRKRHDQEKSDLISAIDTAHNSQREAQIKAINERIFQTVYERNIPDKFFRAIEEQMLRSFFLRTHSEFQLVLEEFDDRHAKILIRHTFRIKNLSSSVATYTMRSGFDVIKSLASHYKVNAFKVGNSSLEGDALAPAPECKSEMHEWWELKLDHSLNPEETVECVFEFVRISPKVGKEAICTLLPTESMSIQVFDRARSFSVRAMTLHPRPEIVKINDTVNGRYQWELDGALFPGQGFLIDWMPKTVMAQAVAANDSEAGGTDPQDPGPRPSSEAAVVELHATGQSPG